jgi:YidC/Oxa1 family membrane protein insertase
MLLVPANIFQPLIDVFESILKFFHNSIGISWGWAIVLLTVCVRLLLVPLMLKQFHSMQAMQRLQPQMKELQKKYKDDKERQQQEMMKFYRENNVNPMASCLPLVAQLPVFISLYYMLRQSLRGDVCPNVQKKFQETYAHTYMQTHNVSLQAAQHAAAGQTTACGPGHGASFLFIGDITNTATGLTLVILIVLYVGTQLLSTLLMSAPTMDKQQKYLMMVLPVFFVFFIIRFPAGVLVYWITTNTWQTAQGYVFRRRIAHSLPPPAAGTPALATSGGGGGGRNGRDGNGNGTAAATGGFAGLLRARTKPEEQVVDEQPAKVGGGSSSSSSGSSKDGGKGNASQQRQPGSKPPPSPRKRKKRSGRRR